MNEVEQYGEVYRELKRAKRWDTPQDVLRLAALTLLPLEIEGLGSRLEAAAARLRLGSGWMDPLRSHMRHAIAATILRRDLETAQVVASIADVREGFRERRLSRSGAAETLAAVLLAIDANGEDVAPETLDAMADLLGTWKHNHRWLTGRDDYPMAAYHAARGADPARLSNRIETLFEGLKRSGLSASGNLQQVCHLLAVSPETEEAMIHRFMAIRHQAERSRLPVRGSSQTELALLSLGHGHAITLAERASHLRSSLRSSRSRPSRQLASTLAIGLILGTDEEGQPVREAGQMTSLHSVLIAQQVQLIAGTTAMVALAATAA